MTTTTRRNERGQVVVVFALLLPILLGIGAIVIGIGNWYTHAKHLQTKVDAAALAGGGVWGFPCGPDVDASIEGQARTYVGPHTQADGAVFAGTSFNPQVGGVGASQIHAVLNGSNYYDDDSFASPVDQTSPTGSICEAKILDVKATEDNSFPLFSLIPLYPDIKRKARVQIEEIEGLNGLLPISVRVPKPASGAAIFFDESNGNILQPEGVKYFCEAALASLPLGVQSGLNTWTTWDPSNPRCSTQARVNVAPNTGVAIALSVRPACDAGATPPIVTNCLRDSPFNTVNEFCRQGSGRIVQCFFGTGTGATQSVISGLQFIHGYDTPNVNNGPPALRGAWLTPGGCSGGYGSGYFAAVVPGPCSAVLNANIALGSVTVPNPPGPPVETRTNANTEVKWKIAYGTGNNDDICNFGPTCDLAPAWNTPLSFDLANARNAIALRIRLKKTTVPGKPGCGNNNFNGGCEWYFTGAGRQNTEPNNAFILSNPVQRSFMGDDELSGPIKFLRLNADRGCNNGNGLPDFTDNEAASQPFGQDHCFWLDIGLKGALAKDQDEPPIVFNLKGSQSAVLDCDPGIPNVKQEIVAGCSPFYRVNDFARDPACPPSVNSWGQMQSPPAPYDAEWPPYTCVLTQTGNPRQLLDGFLERFFNDSSNPACPTEGANPAPEYVKGRNYWHDANNSNNTDPATGLDAFTFAETDPTVVHGNNLRKDDPRKILLFMTAYDSFTGSGNEMFPIVRFGSFYVTGLGTGRPGGGLTNEDPCSQGSGASPGAGNTPPPDIRTEPGGAYVWGHFIDNVVPTTNATPSGRLCAPSVSFMPCVAVLVE